MAQITEKILYGIIDAFLDQVEPPPFDGLSPLYIENKHNLWFKAEERVNPALLAVRTPMDGAICVRKSKTEYNLHTPGLYQITRGNLREVVEWHAKQRNLKTTYVYQLTVQKANAEILPRMLESFDLDFTVDL